MRINPEQGAQFAQMLVADDEPLSDINQVIYLTYLLFCSVSLGHSWLQLGLCQNRKLTYLLRGLSNFDKIWHSYAVRPSWPFKSLKCKILKIQDCGCHHLEKSKIEISVWPIATNLASGSSHAALSAAFPHLSYLLLFSLARTFMITVGLCENFSQYCHLFAFLVISDLYVRVGYMHYFSLFMT